MSRSQLAISDYVTDTKSVLDNSLRVLQVWECSIHTSWRMGVFGVWKLCDTLRYFGMRNQATNN